MDFAAEKDRFAGDRDFGDPSTLRVIIVLTK
jgi:hypothetical protein